MWVEIETLSKRPKHKAYSLLPEVCIKNCGTITTFLKAKEGSHKSPLFLRAEEGGLKLQLLSDFLSFQMKQICIIKNAMVYM